MDKKTDKDDLCKKVRSVIYNLPIRCVGDWANIYGCTHGCKYCYALACMHKKPEEWHNAARARGDNVLALFDKDCAKLAKERADDETRRVLFCFLSDPYQPM